MASETTLRMLNAGAGSPNDGFGLPRRFAVTAADPGGAQPVFEEAVPPGAGPPLHVHLAQPVSFRVEAGTVSVRAGDEDTVATDGDNPVIPAGTAHAFPNIGTDTARPTATLTPGGAEAFFGEVSGSGVTPADAERFAAVARWHGIAFAGPPL